MAWSFPWSYTRPSVDEEIAKKIGAAIKLPDVTSVHKAVLPAKPIPFVGKGRLLTTAEIVEHFGKPNDPANLVSLVPPYPLTLAWPPSSLVKNMTCHKKVAPYLSKVFDDLLAEYGTANLKRLGIDLYGGLFNHRPQRGLEKKYEVAINAGNNALAMTYLSRHSWAIAIDLDPARNGLKTKWAKASFSKPEYKPMVDSFHKHGFIGYGPERNYDAMHWEIGILL